MFPGFRLWRVPARSAGMAAKFVANFGVTALEPLKANRNEHRAGKKAGALPQDRKMDPPNREL